MDSLKPLKPLPKLRNFQFEFLEMNLVIDATDTEQLLNELAVILPLDQLDMTTFNFGKFNLATAFTVESDMAIVNRLYKFFGQVHPSFQDAIVVNPESVDLSPPPLFFFFEALYKYKGRLFFLALFEALF